MALTRKFLRAMGIEEEKIEQIIEAHGDTVEGLKKDIETYKADAEKLSGVQKELDDLKAKGEDGYKEKYESEKKAFAAYKADVEGKQEYAKKEKAYTDLLKAAGVKEKFIATILRADKSVIDSLEIKDGKISDDATVTNDAKSRWADFVATTHTQTAGVETPPANNGGGTKTKEEIYRMENGRYVLSARQRQAELAKLYESEGR